MSLISKRISTRKFTSQKVSHDLLLDLSQAGLSAPSSKNKMPWQFIVINNQDIIDDCCTFHPNWKPLLHSSSIIIVCGDLSQDDRIPQLLMSCSAATQNILLRATELDLGSVWLGVYPDDSRINYLKEILNLPQHILPISLISVGYPVESQEKIRTIDSTKIHFNHW